MLLLRLAKITQNFLFVLKPFKFKHTLRKNVRETVFIFDDNPECAHKYLKSMSDSAFFRKSGLLLCIV